MQSGASDLMPEIFSSNSVDEPTFADAAGALFSILISTAFAGAGATGAA